MLRRQNVELMLKIKDVDGKTYHRYYSEYNGQLEGVIEFINYRRLRDARPERNRHCENNRQCYILHFLQ